VGADHAFVQEVRATLAAEGDPERAAQQQAYLKSALPFHGLGVPATRRALRPLLAAYAPADRSTHEATVRALWDGATHREEWYAAIALVRLRRLSEWLDPEGLPLLAHLVTTGAWWDVVDEVATHPVADTLLAHRERTTPTIAAWAVGQDPWLRRTAVICQVGAGDATDLDLLRHAVEANLDDRTSWLRKAIGWALRRVGPAVLRAHRPGVGARRGGAVRRPAQRPVAARGAQAPGPPIRPSRPTRLDHAHPSGRRPRTRV
jgi:3-methyladenine DNA glycosylase AlkD